MIKMMHFFNSSPFGMDKISKDCVTGVKLPGKPSTSSESEPHIVSIESAVEETQPKDQMKTESQGQDSVLGDSHEPSTEANESCPHSSECRDSPKKKKKGIKGKLKDAFSNFWGGQKIENLIENDGALTGTVCQFYLHIWPPHNH